MRTEVTEQHLLKRYRNWIGRQVLIVDNEYKIVQGRFPDSIFGLAIKCYKKINGKWVYLEWYYTHQFYKESFEIDRFISQCEWEYKRKKNKRKGYIL